MSPDLIPALGVLGLAYVTGTFHGLWMAWSQSARVDAGVAKAARLVDDLSRRANGIHESQGGVPWPK